MYHVYTWPASSSPLPPSQSSSIRIVLFLKKKKKIRNPNNRENKHKRVWGGPVGQGGPESEKKGISRSKGGLGQGAPGLPSQPTPASPTARPRLVLHQGAPDLPSQFALAAYPGSTRLRDGLYQGTWGALGPVSRARPAGTSASAV